MGDFFPRFQQIFRQAEESAVIRGAHDAEKATDVPGKIMRNHNKIENRSL